MNVDPDVVEIAAQEWYDRKSALMVGILGEEHNEVMHAITPSALGGGLDQMLGGGGVGVGKLGTGVCL
jgi:hypothetical protein